MNSDSSQLQQARVAEAASRSGVEEHRAGEKAQNGGGVKLPDAESRKADPQVEAYYRDQIVPLMRELRDRFLKVSQALGPPAVEAPIKPWTILSTFPNSGTSVHYISVCSFGMNLTGSPVTVFSLLAKAMLS